MPVQTQKAKSSRIPDSAVMALSIACLASSWAVLAWLLDDESILPGPAAVGR